MIKLDLPFLCRKENKNKNMNNNNKNKMKKGKQFNQNTENIVELFGYPVT